MEEVQCSLLGYQGGSVLPSLSPKLRDKLHPSEAAIVIDAIQVGEHYGTLKQFCHETATNVSMTSSTHSGFYAVSLAAGVEKILKAYEEDVHCLQDITDVQRLRQKFHSVLPKLTRLISSSKVDDTLHQIDQFVANLDAPRPFRLAIGDSCTMNMLYHIAHWVAHGELLSSSSDFFVKTGSGGDDDGTELAYADRASGSALLFHIDGQRIPPTMTEQLAVSILLAGNERATMLKENHHLQAEKQRFVQVRDLGMTDEAGMAIFDSLYNKSLCREGCLRIDELETRVEAAKNLWSRQLWTSVSTASQLDAYLVALRDMFLCQRGDFWHTFVELAFPRVCETKPSAKIADLLRPVRQAYTAAMSMTNCIDLPIHSKFTIDFDGGAMNVAPGAKPDEIGSVLLRRIKKIALNFDLPYGTHLVVTEASLSHYRSLFSMHMQMRFVLQGLQYCRRFVGEVDRAMTTSRSQGRVLAILHTLTFIHQNLSYFLQVDIQDAQFSEVMRKLKNDVKSVDGATKVHTHYIHEVLKGGFFADDSTEVSRITEQFFILGLGLFALCSRDDASNSLQHRPSTEFSMGLNLIEKRLKQELPNLELQLSLSQQQHRALWTRLNFNKFFSSGLGRGQAAAPSSLPAATAAASTTYHDVDAMPKRAAGGGGVAGARSISAIIDGGGQQFGGSSAHQGKAVSTDIPQRRPPPGGGATSVARVHDDDEIIDVDES